MTHTIVTKLWPSLGNFLCMPVGEPMEIEARTVTDPGRVDPGRVHPSSTMPSIALEACIFLC